MLSGFCSFREVLRDVNRCLRAMKGSGLEREDISWVGGERDGRRALCWVAEGRTIVVRSPMRL